MNEGSQQRCAWSWVGRLDYGRALSIQNARVAARQQDRVDDGLLLLEHPPVVTLGRNAEAENVRATLSSMQERGVELFRTGRGGDVTFHGPGQLVGYPVVDLKPDRRDVHRYVRDLEEVLIRTAGDFRVQAMRVAGLTGVWVGREKLAAIGVRISRWVTSHGFAFNVSTELDYFDLIVPCGIPDRGITSLERLLGRKIPLEEVAARVATHFGQVFGREMIRSTPDELLAVDGAPVAPEAST